MTLRTLFSFWGPISRREYISVAFAGVLLKHIVDLGIALLAFHRSWSPLNYIVPLGIPIADLSRSDLRFLIVMVTVSIPFAWIGTAITVKRFRTIGWPFWTVAFFFVPIANVASFAVAAVWPERTVASHEILPPWLERVVPDDWLGSSVLALVITGILGIGLVALGTKVLGSYGWGLFAAIPFAQGTISALVLGVHRHPTIVECLVAALLSVTLTCAALLAVALEGAVCIAMAAPLAICFALLGAAFGYALLMAPRGRRGGVVSLLVCALIAPSMMGVESGLSRAAPTYRVETSVVVNAPLSTVWKSVVSFGELPRPTELPFLLGIAYPVSAHIAGSGVGAVRFCQFSTGSFVEPITSWEPGKRLAFNVVHSPEPMHELSPFAHLDTPHLHGYMVSRRGEFILQKLPGNRTLLIGRTWYQHHLWPAAYWTMFSGAIIHTIHLRVLNYVKVLAEDRNSPPRSACARERCSTSFRITSAFKRRTATVTKAAL